MFVQHGIAGHQMSDIAHQHQAAPWQHQRCAIYTCVFAVSRQPACVINTVFFEYTAQITAHQSKPVAVDRYFVSGINGCH